MLWRIKGDDLYAKGQYNESLAAYEKSTTIDPYSFKSWEGKGKVLLALGRGEDAAKALTRALKLDPADAEVYALLGDARNATGDYQVAAEQYLKALAMDPKIAGVTEKLSAVYAAEKMVLSDGTETVAPIETITTPAVTQNVTIAETTVALPTTTKAGLPGAFMGVLGILVCLLIVRMRRG